MPDTITDAARQIADSIIESARNSGDDPIAWVTGNAYMPPLRSFAPAENIWQATAWSDEGESWERLTELIDRYLDEAKVEMTCPEWDNALYAVDLNRFMYVESADGETLQSDWAALPEN